MKNVSRLILILALAQFARAADVPKSPYISIVYRYADTMLKTQSDLHPYDQNLLRILYTLGELSGKPIYRDAADAQLKWILQNQPPIPGKSRPRPWMLWDRCWQLDRERTMAMCRSASPPDSLLECGFFIRMLAAAQPQPDSAILSDSIDATILKCQGMKGDAVARLSLAIDSGGGATRLPEPLASKLRALAQDQDQAFLTEVQQLLEKSPHWQSRPDQKSTAMIAMMCVSRYENTGNIKYRDLIHAAADLYRDSPPPEDAELWPMTFGHAIGLELAAWRSASRREYLDAAIKLADQAVKKFWNDNPLPRSTTTNPKYDTITGADTLALSLLELHLSILHITAVRCPPNTIDR
jgi:hypothetical protein